MEQENEFVADRLLAGYIFWGSCLMDRPRLSPLPLPLLLMLLLLLLLLLMLLLPLLFLFVIP